MRRGMHTSQALFPLRFEPGILRVRPWKELLATGAQTTWFGFSNFVSMREPLFWYSKILIVNEPDQT